MHAIERNRDLMSGTVTAGRNERRTADDHHGRVDRSSSVRRRSVQLYLICAYRTVVIVWWTERRTNGWVLEKIGTGKMPRNIAL